MAGSISKEQLIIQLRAQGVNLTKAQLKKLDAQGRFKSDDEIGFFFKTVMTLQELLNEFKIKEI